MKATPSTEWSRVPIEEKTGKADDLWRSKASTIDMHTAKQKSTVELHLPYLL